MATPALTQLVTEAQFQRFADLIYRRTGVRMSPQKRMLLSNRLRRRMRPLALNCYDEYLALLNRLPQADPEWSRFLQEITTHETYLFRDETHWKWFREEYLPQIVREARAGERDRRLLVWSAACSTGDEAATIACCLAEAIADVAQWKIEIVGTDIGADAVEHARAGNFGSRSMRLASAERRRRYFDDTADGHWKLKPQYRQWMRFVQHNLLSPAPVTNVDVAFVKNVLIYFDAESKAKALGHVDRALSPGGKLVTGPAEGIHLLLQSYRRLQPWLRQKPQRVEASSREAGRF